ncbi:hypothetical protein AGMMS49525_12910 [Bacteroidia bacterium]|nr:hypothetical protein AGMMS49525_12910 [Bacteroidia bacterium]
MKKIFFLVVCLFSFLIASAQYSVTGGNGTPLLVADNTASRIQVYLLNGLANAQLSFTSTATGTHQWYKYTTRAANAVPIVSTQTGNTSTITALTDGCGYFVGEATDPATSYIWIIDYSQHLPNFFSMTVDDEEFKCQNIKLLADIEADPLDYTVYSGARFDLPRTYHLLYDNLQWDDALAQFIPEKVDLPIKGIVSEITLSAPLTNTTFTLSGDEFSEHFGLEKTLSTPVYESVAVEAQVTCRRLPATEEPLAGDMNFSAPVELRFEAVANEPAAAMFIWEIIKIDRESKDSTTIVRYTDKTMTYTFRESGFFRVRLEVIGIHSTCFNREHFFDINIGESLLFLPNAFSPGASIGTNDEYRVTYKSLIRFKASIFNRWGNLLYTWTDPDKGWDGKSKGKYVPTGVYFIVVDAEGADGKHYKVSKDVNVLR